MRKKRKKLIILALALLILFLLSTAKKSLSKSFYENISSLVCDEKHGKTALQELCTSYSQGEIIGNFCNDLCKTGQMTIEQCLSHKNDNVIFSATWKQRSVILKAKKMSPYSSWEIVFPESSNQNITELQNSFMVAVYDYVTLQLIHYKHLNSGHSLSKLSRDDLVTQLFNKSASNLSRNEMQTLWVLLQQDEYLLMQLLRDFKHIPHIYGICGQFYAVEKVKTLNEYMGSFLSSPVSWRVQANIALEILDVLQELDSRILHGFSWELCDIQPSNLGVNSRGIVKAIDIDLMYTGEKIVEILMQQDGNCSSHKDCEFFDCASLCDMESNKCTSVKVSNNLQVVCRDLFMKSNWFENGLLASVPSHSKTKFHKILQECVTKTARPWTKRKYSRIFSTLKRYLSEERIYEKN